MSARKNVVIEEIKRHQDTPEEQVHDILAEVLWKGHKIGNSVIGLAEVIQGLDRESILSFVNEYYRPNAILVSAAGNLEHQQLVDIVSEKFGALQGSSKGREESKVEPNLSTKLIEKNTEQVHFCLGAPGFSQREKEKYALATIDSILGGGMSSRLFQEIRENRGLAYAIGSYSASYSEAGLFAIYGGTSIERVNEVLELTRSECENIGRNSVTDQELERAKNQIRGSLVMGQESMSNRMSRLAKSEMYFGRITRLQEIIKAIMDVTKDDVAAVASKLFSNAEFALVAIGPFEKYGNLIGIKGQ